MRHWRRPWRPRSATTALFLAAGIGIGAWAACIPALKIGLGLDNAALSLGLLAFAAGAIVAMPVSGLLGIRFGAHRVAALGGLAAAVCLVLPGLAGGLATLIGAAFLLGAANGVLDVCMNAHATEVERAWGSPIMSSFHAAFSLGGLAGAGAGGVLLAHGLEPWGVLGAGGAGIAALVVGAALLDTAAAPGPASRHGAAGATFALPSRELLGLGVLTFLCMMFEGAVADWSGVFLATVTGASLAVAASGYAAFAVAMVAGRLLGDRIVALAGGLLVVRLGGLLAGTGMAFALLVAQPVPTVAGFGLIGLGLANTIPVLFSAAGRASAGGPSVGVAMAATLGYGGFLLGPPMIGLAADAAGLRLALMILVGAALLTALLARPVLRPSRSQTVASRAAT